MPNPVQNNKPPTTTAVRELRRLLQLRVRVCEEGTAVNGRVDSVNNGRAVASRDTLMLRMAANDVRGV